MKRFLLLVIVISVSTTACKSGYNAYPTTVDQGVVKCVRVDHWKEAGSGKNDPVITDEYEQFCTTTSTKPPGR